MLLKIQVTGDGRSETLMLCESCIDVCVDTWRFGSRVLQSSWERRSRVARVSANYVESLCMVCGERKSEYVVTRFDDVVKGGTGYDKRCVRCLFSSLEAMKRSGAMVGKFPFAEAVDAFQLSV